MSTFFLPIRYTNTTNIIVCRKITAKNSPQNNKITQLICESIECFSHGMTPHWKIALKITKSLSWFANQLNVFHTAWPRTEKGTPKIDPDFQESSLEGESLPANMWNAGSTNMYQQNIGLQCRKVLQSLQSLHKHLSSFSFLIFFLPKFFTVSGSLISGGRKFQIFGLWCDSLSVP